MTPFFQFILYDFKKDVWNSQKKNKVSGLIINMY